MDQSLLIQAGVSATTISILVILYRVYLAVNHHRIRSTCCGKDFNASIDIEETTPKTVVIKQVEIVEPVKQSEPHHVSASRDEPEHPTRP
jgi:hypothetical protein